MNVMRMRSRVWWQPGWGWMGKHKRGSGLMFTRWENALHYALTGEDREKEEGGGA